MKTSTKALALLLCIHTAAGLQCFTSSGANVTCSSSQTRCRSTFCSGVYNVNFMGCVSPDECPPQNGLYSFNDGSGSIVCNATCCDSDLCNPIMTYPVVPPAGSLQCSTLNNKVTCNTLETVCFEGYVEGLYGRMYNVSGCGSENVLNNSSVSLPPFYYNSPGYLARASTATTTTTTTATAPTTTTTTATAPTTTTTAPTTTTAAPTTIATTIATTTTTTTAPTTTTTAPTTATTAPTTTTTTTAPTTTTATTAPTTTTTAQTTTTASPTATADPNTSSSAPPAGSLQCFSCDDDDDEDATNCSATVTCNALETCFERICASGRRSYGCGSVNMCHKPDVTCCNTSNCNRPCSATAAPPTTAMTPPTTAMDDDDDSVFCAAWRVLPAALLLTLLQLYVYTEHF